ncbi:MAG: 6-phosphogluconolactonase [Anaerolineales bacterium]|nr:6-phosphogluconolactonase [Anaerolineales bacterium]
MIHNPSTEVKIYANLDEWSIASALWIRDTIQSSIEETGRCTIALSGGRTPRSVYKQLASPLIADSIHWEHLFTFWGDERAVGPDHPDSNFRMVQEVLLDKVPLPAKNIFRVKGELPPEIAVEEYQRLLSEYFSSIGENAPVFDLILLGLNVDGHIASLFPHTELLSATEQRWVASTYVPRLNSWRITLTPRTLNHARRIAFLVFGDKKSEILHHVFEEPRDPDRYPAQLIQPISGKIVWLVDQEAAKLLSLPDKEGQ